MDTQNYWPVIDHDKHACELGTRHGHWDVLISIFSTFILPNSLLFQKHRLFNMERAWSQTDTSSIQTHEIVQIISTAINQPLILYYLSKTEGAK